MNIDRNKLIEEQRLREYIKRAIKVVQKKMIAENSKSKEDENKLREYIVKLVEADSNVAAPHESTGINVLEDLLKKIIPQLEIEYKILTTDPEQRSSFRSHILNAIQNSLAPTKISDKAGSEEEAGKAIDIGLEEAQSEKRSNLALDIQGLKPNNTLVIERGQPGDPDKIFIKRNKDETYSLFSDFYRKPVPAESHQNISEEEVLSWVTSVEKGSNWRELFRGELRELSESQEKALFEADVEMEVGEEGEGLTNQEEFIDIDGDNAPEEDTEEEKFSIEGEDETGRNIAFSAFERIEQAVVSSYSLLSNDDDRELFYDYLITNVKLYFDKFEDELLRTLPEPTTPEYEAEKGAQLDAPEEPLEEPEDLEF